MYDIFDAQKRQINQLCTNTQRKVTDVYRTNTYAAQLQGILQKLDSLLGIYESLKPTVTRMSDDKRKEYAQLLNNIATEFNFLKATSAAMDDQLKELKDSGNIEHTISGKILKLKKEANKISIKTEQTLKEL